MTANSYSVTLLQASLDIDSCWLWLHCIDVAVCVVTLHLMSATAIVLYFMCGKMTTEYYTYNAVFAVCPQKMN